jgi:hypothetical protein
MSCAICWDAMDMEEYNDEHDSTETCFKLECGHAFHTKCIILVLQKTKHSCPSCNKEKPPAEALEIVGLASKFFKQALRDPEVSALRKEFNLATTEYKNILKKHRKACREIVQKLTEEMNLIDYRSYYLKSLETLKREVKSKVEEMGPKYIGAALFKKERWDAPLIESLLIPGYRQFRWRFYQLKYPRFSCPIYTTFKNK